MRHYNVDVSAFGRDLKRVFDQLDQLQTEVVRTETVEVAQVHVRPWLESLKAPPGFSKF